MAIHESLTLIYDSSCPSNVGTGLRASVMLHLAGLRLLNEVEPVINGLEKMGLAAIGDPDHVAKRLLALIEDEALGQNAAFMELWTDTRFEPAHRLYESLGYRRGAVGRTLSDRSGSREYHYRKEL